MPNGTGSIYRVSVPPGGHIKSWLSIIFDLLELVS